MKIIEDPTGILGSIVRLEDRIQREKVEKEERSPTERYEDWFHNLSLASNSIPHNKHNQEEFYKYTFMTT